MNDHSTETTSLLHHRGSSQLGYTDIPSSFPEQEPLLSNDTNKKFRWFGKQSRLTEEHAGIRPRSDTYFSIDWIHDRVKEGIRKRKLQSIAGYRGQALRASDASQAWILVIITGAVIAAIAWFIDVAQEWMSDFRLGYCSHNWYLNRNFCCWENKYETCHAWKTWPEVFGIKGKSATYYMALTMYTVVGLLFSFVAATLVTSTGEQVNVRTPSKEISFSKSPSMESIVPNDVNNKDQSLDSSTYETKTMYYSAGSGIPEVKVILGGFVIKGFLGIKTLVVKSVGMILSTSAGLTLGKEGPFVHLACSVGNIACRLFPKYSKNESKKREILSASSAAGVAVAFGAPIGGVLFSLEEVSYYFPTKTMIRSYCCAMVAAVVLKITDPFGTGKIVLFQVFYDKEYHLFELVPLIICGALAGFFGAFMTYFNIKFQHLRKTSFIKKYPICEVLCIMLITSMVSFWNPLSRMGLGELVAHLFSECSPSDNNEVTCARTVAEIPHMLYLLITTLVIKIGLTVITFGCAVPGGVFLPSFVIGAVVGRIIGLIMQYLTYTYPSVWPFTSCAEDLVTRGSCIIPGVYAIIGAAASLAGVTRTTISLVVTMFELTYSLTYALPIMIAVMVAKWVADAMFPEGIYDLLIELKQYPFLESRKEYVHNMTIMDVTEYLSTIHLDEPMTVGKLDHKLSILHAMGYGDDGGFPILSNDDILEGYIATAEVTHVLEKLKKTLKSTMDEHEINNVSCHFNQLINNIHDTVQPPMSSMFETSADTPYDHVETMMQKRPLNDFSRYIHHAPLSINQNTSMTLLIDMFTKLGAQYVCVTNSNGRYLGIIHKRRLSAYLKDLEEETVI